MKKSLLIILSFLTISIFFLSLIGYSECKKQKHTHDYFIKNVDSSYLQKTATCTNKETYYYSCSCGEKGSKTFEVGALASHSYTATFVAPTCLDRGYTVYTCELCSYSYTGDYIDATGHSYTKQDTSSRYLKSSATCTSKAVYYYNCACGEKGSETFESGSTLPHSYESSIIAPTCTEEGHTVNICSVCNNSYVSDQIGALGHNYASVTTEPTCSERGYVTHTCSTCGNSYIDNYTNALGHADDGFGNCTDCGLNFAEHIHNYTEQNTDSAYLKAPATCTSKAIYYYSCACGEKGSVTFENGAVLDHSYTSSITDPTCTESGHTTYVCFVCNHSYVSDKTTALGHNYASVTTEPTCTSQGFTTYTCKSCGYSYTDDYVTAPGHEYTQRNTNSRYQKISASCTSKAVYYYSCACGAKGSSTFTSGSTLNHSYESSIIAPTCIEQGYTIHNCLSCGSSYIDNYVDATGHSDDGTGICSICGVYTEEHVHSYTEQNTDPAYLKSAATCGSRAIYYYSCACGEKGSETFGNGDALGHNFTSVVTAPTCTEQGYTTRTCSVCGTVRKQSYVDATGHTDAGNGVCSACGEACGDSGEHVHAYNEKNTAIGYRVSEATCTSKAVYYYSCTCGAWTTEEIFEYGDVDLANHGVSEVEYEYVDGTYHLKVCFCPDCGFEHYAETQEHRGESGDTCRRCNGYIGMNAGEHTHNYTEQNTAGTYLKSAATCSTKAIYYYSCVCGEKGTETFGAGSALGHSFTSVVTEPTCTTQGYTTRTCSVCGTIRKQSYVDPTGHTDDGTGICAICGEPYSASGDHTHVNDGSGICSICGEVIASSGGHTHAYNVQNTAIGYMVSKASCTSPAIYYYSCTCGAWTTEATFEYGDIDLTNHGTIERVYVYVDGTYHLRTGVCTTCGETTSSVQEEHRADGDSSTCRRCNGHIG